MVYTISVVVFTSITVWIQISSLHVSLNIFQHSLIAGIIHFLQLFLHILSYNTLHYKLVR
jgi:hypothetical protein